MKVLLANPAYAIDIGNGYERYFFCVGSRCPWSLIKRKDQRPRYSMFPFFMGYSAALLEKDGFDVEVIDAVPLNLTHDDFIYQAVNAKPDIILLEPATTSFASIIRIAETLKQKTGAKIIMAGSHVSVFPGETLVRFHFVDFVLLEEYEYSLLGLVHLLNFKSEISELDGIAFRNNKGDIVINKKTRYADLNELPMPARHLFPSKSQHGMEYYHDGFCQDKPAVQLHASRGCPFSCSFCLWTQTLFKPHSYRMLSHVKVVDEMISVKGQFNAKEIYFDDDTFTGNKNHVLQICNEILRRKVKIPWSVMGDAMITDEEMLVKMKEAGCIGIKLGLESGVPEILKNINKPLKLRKLEKVIDVCKKLRIKTHVSVSLGHLGETKETVRQTIDYVDNLNSDSIQFSLATPYPGTRFYNELLSKELIKDIDWCEFDPTHNYILDLPDLSSAFLCETEAKAHGHWLIKKILKPEWVFRQAYYLLYLLKKQGLSGLMARIKRAVDIIFYSKFK
jgi:anaerobic magnesium-protoporphyrin IX monomethyl ester cyclase